MFGALGVSKRALSEALGRLRGRLGFPAPLDPEVELWARRVFGEFRNAPLVQPSRDLSQAVLERLHHLHDGGGD